MIRTSEEMKAHLQALKEKRKSGALSVQEYYRALVSVLIDLADTLADEANRMEESAMRKQIPLLLVLLEDQIQALGDR